MLLHIYIFNTTALHAVIYNVLKIAPLNSEAECKYHIVHYYMIYDYS